MTPGLVAHGGLVPGELRRLGLEPGGLLDFSSNVNPFGPSSRVAAALAAVPLDVHPDPDCLELRERLAMENDLPGPEWVVAGNGSVELIRLVCQALASRGEAVLVAEPTFSEYAWAAQLSGARVERVWLGIDYPAGDLLPALQARRPRLVFLANPNNPTGSYWSAGEIEAVLQALPPEGWLVLDEAFAAFAVRRWPSQGLIGDERLIVLRSMTKDHALAALRLGYALAIPAVIERLERLRPAWSVNALAQAAGLAALDDREHLLASLERVRTLSGEFAGLLRERGFAPHPTAVHFFLLEVGEADGVRQRLLQRGLLVRSASSFGLRRHIRLGTRRASENESLAAALEEMVSG